VLGQLYDKLGSKVENHEISQEKRAQLLRRVGLLVRPMEVSGGMAGVRAGEQEIVE
jgi:hypothetical protein